MKSLPDPARRREEMIARSGMYRLLARLWLRETDQHLLRDLSTPPLNASFLAVGGVAPADRSTFALETLAVDYCRLFVGPSEHLPPVQSVWRHGQFQSQTTTSMLEFMEVAGFDPAWAPDGAMVDHFGVQCGVMGHILSRAADETRAEHVDLFGDLLSVFFLRHLSWTEPLMDAAGLRAQTDFYRSVVGLTRAFLAGETDRLVDEEES